MGNHSPLQRIQSRNTVLYQSNNVPHVWEFVPTRETNVPFYVSQCRTTESATEKIYYKMVKSSKKSMIWKKCLHLSMMPGNLYENIEEKPVKIDKWDSAALKNALDDGAKKVMLDKFGFKESHRLMDGRLLICSVAVGFAAFALIWDYFRPFPESRPVLITCVLSYFILMGVLTIYTTYMEKGIFLVALDKDRAKVDPDNRWELSSYLKKYDDKYTLSMVYTEGKTAKTRTGQITKSVAEYFDDDGKFCLDLFEPEVRMLQSRIATSKKD